MDHCDFPCSPAAQSEESEEHIVAKLCKPLENLTDILQLLMKELPMIVIYVENVTKQSRVYV